MYYHSTRDKNLRLTFNDAVLKGLSDEGGLFVPSEIPHMNLRPQDWLQATYQDVATTVLQLFMPQTPPDRLKKMVDQAYSKFNHPQVAPVVKVGDTYVLELFHGPTQAFKDIALTLLPYLMQEAKAEGARQEKTVILTATSGDTGKAALEAFKDVKGFEVVVYFPAYGVSRIQEMQMRTQRGANTHVCGINGDFDQAQHRVKAMFKDDDLRTSLAQANQVLSSANSINIGRLLPQVAYYVWSYLQLYKQGALKDGHAFDVTVPSGNFGNALAAYYAKKMGVPIHNIVVATNENDVLDRFFKSGTYAPSDHLKVSMSPSMDILKASNLERLLYALCGSKSQVSAWMKAINQGGSLSLDPNLLEGFLSRAVGQDDLKAAIDRCFKDQAYVLDPHTAVGHVAAQAYSQERPMVLVATASPYKFSEGVLKAIKDHASDQPLVALHDLSGIPIPKAIDELATLPLNHQGVTPVDKMQDFLLTALGGQS